MLNFLMRINMFFMIKSVKVLRAYNYVCHKVSNLMIKGFESEPVYDNKYIKTKVKSFHYQIKTF